MTLSTLATRADGAPFGRYELALRCLERTLRDPAKPALGWTWTEAELAIEFWHAPDMAHALAAAKNMHEFDGDTVISIHLLVAEQAIALYERNR